MQFIRYEQKIKSKNKIEIFVVWKILIISESMWKILKVISCDQNFAYTAFWLSRNMECSFIKIMKVLLEKIKWYFNIKKHLNWTSGILNEIKLSWIKKSLLFRLKVFFILKYHCIFFHQQFHPEDIFGHPIFF